MKHFIFLILGLFCGLSHGAITWNFTFEDDAGVGFNEGALGTQRRAVLTEVTTYINSFIDADGTIDIAVKKSDTMTGSALASAGVIYPYGTSAETGSATTTFRDGFPFTHANTGTDPSTFPTDTNLTFNFNTITDWNYDSSAASGSGNYDMFSTALHEFGHILGIFSLIDSDGSSFYFNRSGGTGLYSEFDRFLVTGSGDRLINEDGLGITRFNASTVSEYTGNDIFFDGANATAANGGAPVRIYAPSSFSNAASLTHTDPSVFGVMRPTASRSDFDFRTFSAIELGMLQDIGWQFNVVPEPSSSMLILLGATVTFSRRRRA